MGRFVSLFLVFVLLQACKTGSVVQVAQQMPVDTVRVVLPIDTIQHEEPKPSVTDERDSKEAADDLSFSYLKAKSRVAWKSGTNTDNYSVDIRVKKDSIIWVNISQSGLTGATGLFGQDRVQFYQKISGEYYNLTYDSLSTMMGFRIDYRMLQSLIVGNQPFKKNNSRVIRENENIIIKQDSGRIKIDNMLGPNRKLKKLLVRDEPSSNKLTLDFEEFTNLNQVIFPFSSQITLDVKNKDDKRVTTVIQIKYSKVELLETPLEFPFRIPAKFLKK
ncbi:DUF4292 domain-containing protein [Aquirufa regiilacus]|uniref:DUF4292 domain-containing protein n=1 Tax=Aquirufa regiilacus TaxID=3024868 RepID=A0ABU3TNR4_9BACT|nr:MULTISPECIES: DUF4292 domain-containing protein [unclassified Aquirufa]MDT8887989.1 DUF4292 domain-containing protein [Aquirufa sp. LEPPI-3A]MDU0807501.1 DUF4292 domain-containing protein [Aquirufa sp. LEOWEIH-7C]